MKIERKLANFRSAQQKFYHQMENENGKSNQTAFLGRLGRMDRGAHVLDTAKNKKHI